MSDDDDIIDSSDDISSDCSDSVDTSEITSEPEPDLTDTDLLDDGADDLPDGDDVDDVETDDVETDVDDVEPDDVETDVDEAEPDEVETDVDDVEPDEVETDVDDVEPDEVETDVDETEPENEIGNDGLDSDIDVPENGQTDADDSGQTGNAPDDDLKNDGAENLPDGGGDINDQNNDYKRRIDKTPINNGRWVDKDGNEGVRGESIWVPDDEGAQAELKKFGLNGIEYKNGYPDFSKVSYFGITLNDDELLDSDRQQFSRCNEELLDTWEYDPDFVKGLDLDEGQEVDLLEGHNPYGYTWHHDPNERGLIMLVPTSIHQACRHEGGRSVWGGGATYR